MFIYKKTAGSWGAPEEIEAPEGEKKDGDYFGVDVAISNGVLLVGADEREAWDSGTNNYQAVRKGKAYVYVDNNDGNGYVHSQTLIPDAAVPDGFRFGSYLALDGDNALIGNFYQGCAGSEVPSVYGFTRDAQGTWGQSFSTSSSSCGYGRGVALKENQGLISDRSGNLRLIGFNGLGSNIDFYPFGDHWRNSESSIFNGNWLALGSGEVFAGNDRGYHSSSSVQAGSVHVYDNFSEVPVSKLCILYSPRNLNRKSLANTSPCTSLEKKSSHTFLAKPGEPLSGYHTKRVGAVKLKSSFSRVIAQHRLAMKIGTSSSGGILQVAGKIASHMTCGSSIISSMTVQG